MTARSLADVNREGAICPRSVVKITPCNDECIKRTPSGARWKKADQAEPLTWNLNILPSVVSIFESDYPGLVQAAIAQWSDALGVTFSQVGGGDTADIRIEINNFPFNGVSERFTTVIPDSVTDIMELGSVGISIPAIRPAELHDLILIEIGRALGIQEITTAWEAKPANSTEYNELSIQDINQGLFRYPGLCPDLDPIYIRSSEDIRTPIEFTLQDTLLTAESITSQEVDFTTGSSSISTFNFSVCDFGENNEFVKWFKAQPGCTLKGARVEYFIGDERLPFHKYVLQTTQEVESLQQQHDEWRFAAAGIQRITQTDIFSEVEGTLFGNVYAANGVDDPDELDVCDSEIWNTTDANGELIGDLKLLNTDPFFRVADGDYYIKLEHEGGCEVLRASARQTQLTSRLIEGDVISGIICVSNNGNSTVYNLSANGPGLYDLITANPSVTGAERLSLAPGETKCLWVWQSNPISDNEAQNEWSPGESEVVVTYSTTTNGPSGPQDRATAHPVFDPQTGVLPVVTEQLPRTSVVVNNFWFEPEEPIECGEKERARVRVPYERYTITERGLFNTPVCRIFDDEGVLIKDGADISQAVILEGALPEVLYTALTGRRYADDDEAWIRDDNALLIPDYSARIAPRYIDKQSFSQSAVPDLWDLSMRFVCPADDVAIDFIELEILRWASHYLREEPDGRLSLQPLNEINEEHVVDVITEDDVFGSPQQITEDWQQPTQLTVAWDWDTCEEKYRSSHLIVNEHATADNCFQRIADYCAFQGVRSDVFSAPAIRNHMRNWLSYKSVPTGKSCTPICLSKALSLRVGQTVMLESSQHRDRFASKPQVMRRPVGISSLRYQHDQGTAVMCYELPLKDPYPSDFEFSSVPCGTVDSYCEGRTELSTVINIAKDGRLLDDVSTIPAGQYCHVGDLTLSGTLNIEATDETHTFGLAVAGKLTLASDFRLEGDEQGFPGYAYGDSVSKVIRQPGYGYNAGGRGGTFTYRYRPQEPESDTRDIYVREIGFGNLGVSDGSSNFPDEFTDTAIAKRAGKQYAEFNPLTLVFNIPVSGSFTPLSGCYHDSDFITVRGRGFDLPNPVSALQMSQWELGGNGGAYGGMQRWRGTDSTVAISPIRGGTGGPGGLGVSILAHDVVVENGARINISGGDGEPPRDNGHVWNGNGIGGVPGTGGNAGRVLIVLDGQNTAFLPQPENWITQRTGDPGPPQHPDAEPLFADPHLCGTRPALSTAERDAVLYRNLNC